MSTPEPTVESPILDETTPIEDLNQFVGLLTAWHEKQVQTLLHLQNAPVGIEVRIGEGDAEESLKLEGDILRGYQLGLSLALNYLGTLPFVAEPSLEDVQH